MTPKEQHRLMVLNQLQARQITTEQASQLLGLSVRHVRRLAASYRNKGAAALVHGNRGRRLPHALDPQVKERVVELARTRYLGFNDSHLTEMLKEEEGIHLSRSSVRRILRAAGVPTPRTRRPPRHRSRRERMPLPGMLIQIDGSHHDWLEGRGPRLVLLAAIDDATNEASSALFRQEEDAQGYLLLFQDFITTHGIPLAVYTDKHGIFQRSPREPLTLAEQLAGKPEPTQVGRALDELNIRWIPASSPQAKGRIERLFGTFQDRLTSELRLRRAKTLEEANAVLQEFLPRYNARFRQPAAQEGHAWRSLPPQKDLDSILCFKYIRTVANDNTVRLGEHLLQILPDSFRQSYAKARVEVHERLDGTLAVYFQGRQLSMQHITPPPPQDGKPVLRSRAGRIPTPSTQSTVPSRGNGEHLRQQDTKQWQPRKPNLDHPWRRYAAANARSKAIRAMGVTFSQNT